MQVSRPLVEKDEYMCLQAVHALAAAVSDNTNGEAPLAQAAGAKGGYTQIAFSPLFMRRLR